MPANEVKTTYRGDIHDVRNNSIILKFNESFHKNYKNEDYAIKFFFSRTSLKKQHHAVEIATQRIPHILFPDKITLKPEQFKVNLNLENGDLRRCDNSVIPWFNTSLNIVQKQAVVNILQGVARPMPYVICGPPGTGKTVTLIETILQIYKHDKRSHILVATPSNSAADLITKRIADSGILEENQFMRLVSQNSVEKELIPDDIMRFCGTIDIAREGTTKVEFKVTESGLKKKCNATYLMSRHLLIGTCITLGTLMQCDFPDDHFSHIIIDESGQCMETIAMIPISFVDRQIGQVILAGDPMQLGPIVFSYFAKKYGLAQSYLERILNSIPYKPDPEVCYV